MLSDYLKNLRMQAIALLFGFGLTSMYSIIVNFIKTGIVQFNLNFFVFFMLSIIGYQTTFLFYKKSKGLKSRILLNFDFLLDIAGFTFLYAPVIYSIQSTFMENEYDAFNAFRCLICCLTGFLLLWFKSFVRSKFKFLKRSFL